MIDHMDDVKRAAETPTAMALLGVLAFGAEVSGYDLRQWTRRTVGHWYTTPAHSQVYRELRSLEAAGYTTSRDVPQMGKPDKVLYSITDAGREALGVWSAKHPPKPLALKHHTMLRLFLAHDTDPAVLRGFLEDHREQTLAALEDLENESATLGADRSQRRQAAVAEWAAEIHRGDLAGTELALKMLDEGD